MARYEKWVKGSDGKWKVEHHVDNCLLVPLRNIDGKLVSIQWIAPSKVPEWGNKDKLLLPGGEKKGCYHQIGEAVEIDGMMTVLVFEGYATAASGYEATGIGSFVAFDADNLRHVAKALRAKHPDWRIVICGDNDQFKPEIGNPGKDKAIAALAAIGQPGCAMIPTFASLDGEPTDINDLSVRQGPEVVKSQILAAIAGDPAHVLPEAPVAPWQEAHEDPESDRLSRAACRAQQREWLDRLNARYAVVNEAGKTVASSSSDRHSGTSSCCTRTKRSRSASQMARSNSRRSATGG
jgi:phage/plasmid primase-like uncharacterized protein